MKRKVAIYARVSTEHEAQLSALDNQVQYYDDLLSKHPEWELYDRYIDEGITGTSVMKRKNFMRMIEDAEKGYFDLIITREVSRFARNTVDTLQETRKLKRIGVEVYFIEDNIWTLNDEDGELKLTIMATLAQNESKKISQRVKAGQKITFQNGVFYGTGNILGYDRIGKDMIVNEEQAKIIKLIFQLYLDGYGATKIKYELEKRGYKTSTGLTVWSPSYISRVLQNPFYCGTIIYRKSYIPDYLEQKAKMNKGEVEQIIVEGKHTPLISKEDFNKVQKMIQAHTKYIESKKKNNPIGKAKYVWSTKLTCECGAKLNRTAFSRRDKDHITYAYHCYNQKNKGSAKKRIAHGLDSEGFCSTPQVQEWKIDVMSYYLFNKILKDKERITKIAYQVIDSVINEIELNNCVTEELESLNKNLNSIKSKMDRLVNGYVDGLIDKEIYISKKQDLESIKIELETKINEVEEKSKIPKNSMAERIKLLKQNLLSKLDFDNNNITDEIIDSFVDKVVVHEDKFDWKLNYLNKIVDTSKNDKSIKGVFFTRLLITREDIKKYNKKHGITTRVCQQEPIIMDIYI